jgi:DNA recombination-dependent growth factor C
VQQRVLREACRTASQQLIDLDHSSGVAAEELLQLLRPLLGGVNWVFLTSSFPSHLVSILWTAVADGIEATHDI